MKYFQVFCLRFPPKIFKIEYFVPKTFLLQYFTLDLPADALVLLIPELFCSGIKYSRWLGTTILATRIPGHGVFVLKSI